MSAPVVIQFETVHRPSSPRLPPEPHRVCFAIVNGQRAEIAVPMVKEDQRTDDILRSHLIWYLTEEGYWPNAPELYRRPRR